MSMNYREVSQGLPKEIAAQYAEGIQAMNDQADSLQREGKLPEWFANQGSSLTIIKKDNPLDHLTKVTEAYRANLYNPEYVAAFHEAFWQVPRGEKGYTFKAPELVWTQEEMARPLKGVERVNGKLREKLYPGMMVAIPEELQGKEGLIVAGRMWPELASRSVREDTPILYAYEQAPGYFKVEKDPVAPNRDTTQADLEKLVTPTHRGQRLITYIAGSEQSKLLADEYFDQNTWSRLLGTLGGGRVVRADFYGYGYLYADWSWHRGLHDSGIGGRFEEVNKT